MNAPARDAVAAAVSAADASTPLVRVAPVPLAAPPIWKVWTALGIVYVIWGSTYLAIAIVVQTLPPLLSAGLRFLVAGALLSTWIVARNGPSALRVSGAELRGAAIVGLALLLGGNGLVMVAERDVPSGLTALIIGSVPLWVLVFRWAGGERVGRLGLVGVLVGFAGVAFLVIPRGVSGEVAPLGLLFLLGATVSWAWGTFVSKRLALPARPLVSTDLQQVAGGVGLVIAGLAVGEWHDLDPASFAPRSVLALGYLVVFGSLVAFSAYTWLLAHAPLATVATYAYVNPLVAVVLGSLILAEPVTASLLVGAVLVIAAVAFIVRQPSAPVDPAAPAQQR